MKKPRGLSPLPIAALFLLFAPWLGAQNLSVTQVDATRLISTGQIEIWASMTDAEGNELPEPEAGGFELQERGPDGVMRPIPISAVTTRAGQADGINVLLLVDNSGSMYDKNEAGLTRMEQVQAALDAFTTQFAPKKDRVGLAVFNTRYRMPSQLGADAPELRAALAAIEKPSRDDAYTELYGSLGQSLDAFQGVSGRRAIIVLSDGEDFPWFKTTGTPHPEWGTASYNSADTLKAFQEAGVTLYAVNFAPERDPDLATVCLGSGGRVFEARDSSELLNVYQGIQRSLSQEVRISAVPPVSPASGRSLLLSYGPGRDEAWFLAPLLLGPAGAVPWLILLLALALVALALVLLFILRFERPAERAELSLVGGNMTVALRDDVTVIGSGPTAHMTLAGQPTIAAEHATIVADRATGMFTLVSDKAVRVNNRPAKNRTLKPGDVIRIEGVTMVFDEPSATQAGAKPKTAAKPAPKPADRTEIRSKPKAKP